MRIIPAAIVASLVMTGCLFAFEGLDSKETRILDGIDGSRARVSKSAFAQTDITHVEICAIGHSPGNGATGISVDDTLPIKVPAGEQRCLSAAPAPHLFVLWRYIAGQPPMRSISIRLDLTRSAGHVLWFEWVEEE